MKRSISVTVMLIVCLLGSVCSADLITIDYPGATFTEAHGISGNNIVGKYRIGDSGYYHGFLYDGTTYTTLDYPGATTSTLAYGISGDNIVGTYNDGTGHLHGFLYDGITYSTYSYPGAIHTQFRGISGNDIVGSYDNGSGHHSFIYDGTTYLNYPGNNSLTGISGDNIIGLYVAGFWHSFLDDGVQLTIIDAPEAEGTKTWGIYDNNIVGMAYQAFGPELTYGFLFDSSTSTFRYLAVPGARWTSVYGIYGDSVVGSYYDGISMHGFMANTSDFSTTIPTVPIPSAFLLSAIGLVVSGWKLRRKTI